MATNYLRKLELGGLHVDSTVDATSYIGDQTDIWTDDNDLGTWRIGDGVTPGGVILFSNGGGGAPTALSDLSNVSTAVPTAGQVLKWSGTQWAPAQDQTNTGAGIALTDLSVTQAAASGGGALSYNDVSGVFSYTPPDLSSYSTFDGDYANLTNTPTLFNGDYFSLTNRPTIPAALADLSNVSSTAPNAGQVLKWDGSEWAPAADSTGGGGSGIALTDLSVGAEGTASGDGAIAYNDTTGVFTYTPPDLSDYATVSGNLASLQTSIASTYQPIGSYLTAETNDLTAAVTWANIPDANVPASAVTQHTAALTITESQISDLGSYLTDYTVTESDVTTHQAALSITESQISDFGTYLTSYTETDTLDDVIGRGATTTTTAVIPFYYANQSAFPNASTYHGAIAHSHSDGAMYFAHGGNWNRLANYTDLSPYQTVGTLGTNIDLHLNQGNPTAGFVLSWDGSDYAWVSNGSTFDGAFGSLTGTPTTLAGYGITDAVGSGSTLDTNTIQTSSGNLTISADNYVRIDSDNNGQIEIGTDSGVGDVRIGNEGNGTSIHMEGVTTFEQNVKIETGVQEKFGTLTGQSGVVAHNCNDGHLFYHTTPAGDITANFTNLGLAQEYATNLTVIINQGATPYEITAIQIEGSAQTINWQGGSAPTGNANGIDSFSFTVLNDGGSYVIMGQMVDFT